MLKSQKSAIKEPKRSTAPRPRSVTIHSLKERSLNMSELLKAFEITWEWFYGIFVRGLINFDNPLMSLMDYIAWSSIIITAAKRALKK